MQIRKINITTIEPSDVEPGKVVLTQTFGSSSISTAFDAQAFGVFLRSMSEAAMTAFGDLATVALREAIEEERVRE